MIRIPIETVQEQTDDSNLLSQLIIAALLAPLSMTFYHYLGLDWRPLSHSFLSLMVFSYLAAIMSKVVFPQIFRQPPSVVATITFVCGTSANFLFAELNQMVIALELPGLLADALGFWVVAIVLGFYSISTLSLNRIKSRFAGPMLPTTTVLRIVISFVVIFMMLRSQTIESEFSCTPPLDPIPQVTF